MCRLILRIIKVIEHCQAPQFLFQQIANDISQEVIDEELSEFIDESHSFIITRLNPYFQTINKNTNQAQNVIPPISLTPAVMAVKAYFDIIEILSPLRDLDKCTRRRLICYI